MTKYTDLGKGNSLPVRGGEVGERLSIDNLGVEADMLLPLTTASQTRQAAARTRYALPNAKAQRLVQRHVAYATDIIGLSLPDSCAYVDVRASHNIVMNDAMVSGKGKLISDQQEASISRYKRMSIPRRISCLGVRL